jgi:phospholipase C
VAGLSRRHFLGSTAATAGLSAAFTLLPTSVQKALASPSMDPGTFSDIKHVIMLMQENRSFDHYFGTLSGVAGFDDPNAIKLSTGRDVFHQPDALNPDGFLLPFHLDTHSTNAQAIPSTSHAYAVQHSAWNHGKMNNWLPAHRAADKANGPYVMGYYKREDIPFQYALADAFTICDAYHSSVLGPTWSNRLYWQTGTINPSGTRGGPITSNSLPKGPLTWTTYAERLEAAGVSWRVYQDQSGLQSFNMLRHFKKFQDAPASSPLHQKGLTPQPTGRFEYDALHDQLPAVSWIITSTGSSEHPSETPAAGAAFVAAKIAAIAANPDVWNKTVFILNYDENDGLFDHVVPPTPPAGTTNEFALGLPVGAGFRVPCIVISPWTAGGWVASERFDHTSVLQFLEKFTGVHEPNITVWRRNTFGDLTSVFRFGNNAHPPTLLDTQSRLNLAKYEVAALPKPKFPGSVQIQPHQEPGSRPHT